MAKYTPGYVDVPGKGRRYRNASGEYFHNHAGSILNSFRKAKKGVGDAYNNYYNNVADAAGTERRDGTKAKPEPNSKDQKPAAPAKPAVDKNGSNGSRGGNRSGVTPVNGSFRTAVEQGPDGKVTPSSGNAGGGTPQPQGSGGSKERVSPTGIVQKGLTLGGIDAMFASLHSSGKITEGGLPSASKFFSEALPLTEEGARQQGHGSLVTGPDGKPMEQETYTWDNEKGALIPPTVPDTTGGKPENPEDGTSSKPDIAEEVRTIRMNRNSGRGSRKDPRNRGGDVSDEPFGGVSETKGNGMTAERRAAVSAFLDPNNKGYAAIRARDRANGAFDQNGTGGIRVGDEIVNFKPGMSADARFELAGGGIQSKEDAQAFLKKYTDTLTSADSTSEVDTEPDSPSATELSPSFAKETPGAQEYFRKYKDGVKDSKK